MKWTVQFLTSAVVLTIQAAPSQSLSITAGLSNAFSEAVEASRAHPNTGRVLKGADLAFSKFDRRIVEAFGKAWRRSGDGTSPLEGVVVILRMVDGTYSGREMGTTNEHRRFTFRWQPGTVAIVHTHPNSSDPKPQDEDLIAAHKYGVPVFTITSRGMYVYDPGPKKISRVLNDMDWLDAAKFSIAASARH